jgi:hypothetical protein
VQQQMVAGSQLSVPKNVVDSAPKLLVNEREILEVEALLLRGKLEGVTRKEIRFCYLFQPQPARSGAEYVIKNGNIWDGVELVAFDVF